MGTRVCFPGGKAAGHEAYHLLPSSAEVKECVELYIYSHNKSSWRVAQIKSTGTILLVSLQLPLKKEKSYVDVNKAIY
jgi:hypothetical protein